MTSRRTPRGLLFYSPYDYLRRFLWAMAQPLWRLSPRWWWAWRNAMLRCFGARIGRGVRVYPAARLIQPWNLALADRVTIGWGATLYALGSIDIGPGTRISQGAHLCAGSHDPRDPGFPLRKLPIRVGADVWIAAEAFIGPGVTIADRSVVGARAVVVRDVPPDAVVAGNPARRVGRR